MILVPAKSCGCGQASVALARQIFRCSSGSCSRFWVQLYSTRRIVYLTGPSAWCRFLGTAVMSTGSKEIGEFFPDTQDTIKKESTGWDGPWWVIMMSWSRWLTLRRGFWWSSTGPTCPIRFMVCTRPQKSVCFFVYICVLSVLLIPENREWLQWSTLVKVCLVGFYRYPLSWRWLFSEMRIFNWS